MRVLKKSEGPIENSSSGTIQTRGVIRKSLRTSPGLMTPCVAVIKRKSMILMKVNMKTTPANPILTIQKIPLMSKVTFAVSSGASVKQ